MDNSLSDIPPDSYKIFIELAIFGLLFCTSIFFSASETAVVSLSSNDISDLEKGKGGKYKKLSGMISKRSELLLVTLLLGNNLANVGIATLAALITRDLFAGTAYGTAAMIIDVFVVGFVLLFVGEIIPKSYAIRNKLNFIKRFSTLMILSSYILYPLAFLIEKFVMIFMGNLKNSDGFSEFTRRDIENLMEVGGEDGALEEDEKNMINSIFEFGEKTAKEIMVPRVDMMTIPENINSDELFEFINTNNFSRIPVYKENIDNIVGILYIKDLLQNNRSINKDLDILKILRPVTFIPESKDIANLLKLFQKEKTHIAIVVDEYGGTSGMITLEDIIEEIVGEIQDEFDEEERLFKKINENCFEFDAKIPIDDLNDIMELDLPEDEDYESLGGYLYELFGEVPETGDKKNLNSFRFTILSVHKQRIGWVRIEKSTKQNEEFQEQEN
ncbi:MAG: hemolysin family protein [Candidatus Delongbacteria bacterium]